MEDAIQNRKLLWIAKTERAYLQVLTNEARKQLAITDDVINARENNLQQNHSIPLAAAEELPERCHDLVPASGFISSVVSDVVRLCLTLRTDNFSPVAATAAATVADDDKEADGSGVSRATTTSRPTPTAHLAAGDASFPVTPASLMTSDVMTSETHLPRDADSTASLQTEEATEVTEINEATEAAPTGRPVRQTVSAETQTPVDWLPEQLAQLTAEGEDQRRLLRHQTDLLAQLHSQLTRSAAENERLQRHLQLVNALFEQLHRKEAGSAPGETDSPRAEGADDTDGAAEEGGGGGGGGDGAAGTDLVERVDTAQGRRLVIHVSRTYLRLRDLILEKRSLLSEIDKLRGFNQQLERRLNKQERRLSNVAAELHNTWGLVTKLKIQHAQLHTAESVLRYELREKRKLMSRLRGELEGSRQRSVLASQLNAESELKWRALRRELDQRKKERLVRQTHVGSQEVGKEPTTGEAADETRPEQSAVLERSATEDSQPDTESIPEPDAAPLEALDTSMAESESTESESAGRRTPESQPGDSVDSAASAGATISAETTSERRRRLVSLEDQCQQLYTRLVSTTARQVALSSRLAELHVQHGASETETTPEASVASSEDTAYASLAETSPTPTEVEQPPADDQPAAGASAVTATVLVQPSLPPLPAVAAVSAVAAEPSSPLAVAAQRVAVHTEGGPRALPPLPASQLATETAHRDGGDRALISAVVAVRELPIGATRQTEPAAASEEEESDTDEPENPTEEAEAAEEAKDGTASASATCEDDVSRSTADLLEKVGKFLSRTRRGSPSAQPPPALSPPAPLAPPSSDSETDEVAGTARPGGAAAGCKLISMLPSRMVHLRREREQLTEHIARLQAQNERIEQKLARMRTERREQRRQGREDSTAKEHLERRVQQLERQLRLQLAERYAVHVPSPTDPEQSSGGAQMEAQEDAEDPSSTGAPSADSELQYNFPPLTPAGDLRAHAPEQNATSEAPRGGPGIEERSMELHDEALRQDPVSDRTGNPMEFSGVSVFQSVNSTEIGTGSEGTTDCGQSEGPSDQQNRAAPSAPTDFTQKNGASPDHSTEDAATAPQEDSDTADRSRSSYEARCSDDGAAAEVDGAPVSPAGTAAELDVSSTDPDDVAVVSGDHPAEHAGHNSAANTPTCEPTRPAEQGPSPEEEEASDAAAAADRPLTRLHQRLADARGQLRSVQDDCRRASHALQQMRAAKEREERATQTAAPDRETVASPPTETPVGNRARNCHSQTTRVNYSEFRRRLTERLPSCPPTHRRTSRHRPASLFKRGAIRCHMCQGALRPLLARRFTCQVCGQLFCRSCACLSVHLPAAGEMRLCVRCFYDLSASAPTSVPPVMNNGTSQPIDPSQAAISGDCSPL